MHDLFKQVLDGKDLSKAGDLFLLPDSLIIPDLPEVLDKIKEVTSNEDYLHKENDQSVVEICVARVTSCVGEFNLINTTCDSLVNLLISCLNYDLKHQPGTKYPPHAKIASDIMACLFLNHTNRAVMREALPVAVKFLHKGNRELTRNVTSYLPLAAIENPDLLAKYVQPIIDSVIGGNFPLARVLPQIYTLTRDRSQEHVMALASILPKCETNDKIALLQLFTHVASDNAMLLEPSLPQLLECLKIYQTTGQTLLVFLAMSSTSRLVAEQMGKIRNCITVNINSISTVAEVLRSVGVSFKDKSAESLSHLISLLNRDDLEASVKTVVLRQILFLCQSNGHLVNGALIERLRILCTSSVHSPLIEKLATQTTLYSTTPNQNHLYSTTNETNQSSLFSTTPSSNIYNSPSLNNNGIYGLYNFSTAPQIQTGTNGITVIRVNDFPNISNSQTSRLVRNRLEANRGRLNGGGPSLHKSLTKLHGRPLALPYQYSKSTSGMSITLHSPSPDSPSNNLLSSPPGHYQQHPSCPRSFSHLTSLASAQTLSTTHSNLSNKASKASLLKGLPPVSHHVAISHPDLSSAFINDENLPPPPGGNRISVFEPYPLRDTVQHFCEKHFDKIKSYMEKLSVKIPLPVKCTIEERKSRKIAKLHFACQDRSSPHCLYSNSLFGMKTQYSRIWIHIMFLALQSRSSNALSTRETSVSSLKNCWDTLKSESKSFLTLVTSAFPSSRDHENLLSELRVSGFFDVFSFNGTFKQWGCFLCNHPERALGILNETNPVLEGEMKEKKGKWRLFKRWRTRYFTLSAGQLSCRDRSSILTTLDLTEIRSVRVSRSHRNIPKAFEIFTEEKTYVLKPKDGKNAEEWVQCLSVLVAHHNQNNKEKKNSIGFGSKIII